MGFHGVYLLYSRNPKYLGRTYIGYTVDPNRRITQHNKGKDFGGAWRTSQRGPWDMVLIIHGFPDDISALRFEWAWQHPKMSRRLQAIPKKKSKETTYEYCLRVLKEMLQIAPWKRLPLTVQWLKPEYQQDLAKPPTGIPCHMLIVIGPIPPSKKTKSQSQRLHYEYETSQCYLCHQLMEEANCLECTHCSTLTHMMCLAEKFLESSDDYVPVNGHCVSCNEYLLWGDLIRNMNNTW
uniref:Structure-specific endonuclease subunit SLX1 homolog n=1 Tax=Cacopsylla melanoneura TaxID=428564 RepID=A0A8D9E2G5_9HEMI